MPLQLSQAQNEHKKAALHLASFLKVLFGFSCAGALYSTKWPTLVCQVSVLLGFVIGKSKNRYKDNASDHHFIVAQPVYLISDTPLSCSCLPKSQCEP